MEVAPTERDNVHGQHTVVEWHELEVRQLHSRPDHPILLQRHGVCLVELVLGALALHQSHGGQEEKQVARGEETLIGSNAGDDSEVRGVGDIDALLQEAEPLGGRGTEDAAAVEGHAGGAGEVVALQAIAFDSLLCERVAGREEDGGGDGLCENRARGQFGLVPAHSRQLEQCGAHVEHMEREVNHTSAASCVVGLWEVLLGWYDVEGSFRVQ